MAGESGGGDAEKPQDGGEKVTSDYESDCASDDGADSGVAARRRRTGGARVPAADRPEPVMPLHNRVRRLHPGAAR